MKNLDRWLSAAALLASTLGAGAPLHAQNCPKPWLCPVAPRQYSYLNFEVTNIAPWPSIEHGPIDVSFTVTPSIQGLAGAVPEARHIQVCPVEKRPGYSCVDLGNLPAGSTRKGTLRAFAPAAGAAAVVRIQVEREPISPGDGTEVFTWEAMSEASRAMPVFARYEIALDDFEILHTRSTLEDTIDIYMQGIEVADPAHPSAREDACELEGAHFCIKKSHYGDADDGHHPLTTIRVGPYDLTPEVESELRFQFTLFNLGDNYAREVLEAIANGISTGGMLALKAYNSSSGSFADALDAQMEKLHGAWAASCDGIAAADAKWFSNVSLSGVDTLDALTRDTGVYRRTGADYKEKDGNLVCGPGGNYSVTWAIYRTSWQAP
jgi:hypothetical protein